MDAEKLFQLISAEMQEVNQFIQTHLKSDVALINQISQYIIHSGGKRLRPILVLLSHLAINHDNHLELEKNEQKRRHQNAIKLAAVIEFIHTATLLHDDVVDESSMRRGNESANELWGNAASVLVGDFLYSRAFEIMVSIRNMKVMEILSHSTNTIAEGEVLQLLNCHDASTTEERYMDVIHCKTAKLFESASQLGAVIHHQDDKTEQAMAKYGMHLGTAFQIIDDVLDYSAQAEQMGKNIGDDLAEGKPTLPLIYALSHCSEDESAIIIHAIETGGLEQIDTISKIIQTSGALEYARQIALKEANLAIEQLQVLPDSLYSQALQELALFSVQRSY